MIRSSKVLYALLLLIFVVLLTGCELRRSDTENSDLAPVGELPPTLVPLGADTDEMTGEATPIPTVINVQATATESPLGAGQAAENPAEPAAPTNQPTSLGVSADTEAGQAVTASVAPETFTAPAAASASQDSIVVDANTSDLPVGGPVATNPPTSQTDPATYGGGAYTVQPGDTLFSIGQAYGLSVEEIMLANGLASDIIYTGQTLTIPTGGVASDFTQPAYEQPAQPAYAPQAPAYSGNGHTVAPGETLYRIALNYGTSVDAIAGANGIPYPYVIQAGQQLVIPGAGEYTAPPPPVGDYYQQPDSGYYQQPDPGYYQQPEQQGGYYQPGPNDGNYYPAPDYNNAPPGGIAGTHTVAPGETLFMIAQRYGVSADMIAAANGLPNPNQIYVGQVLYLP